MSDQRISDDGDWVVDSSGAAVGCTDGTCKLRIEPLRQHTNGGCKCLRGLPTKKRIEVERTLETLKREVQQLRESKRLMDDQRKTTHRTMKTGDTLVLGDRWVRLVYVKTSGKIKLEVCCPDHVRVVRPAENPSNE